ncbi:MAG: NeuD/PglB/VioB family sugar acetyltransferase [Thermonemataceae bacterium]
MDKPVMILGANGIGKIALEIFDSHDIIVYGFLDDDPKQRNTTIHDITVLGATEDQAFLKLIGKKCEAFVASDDDVLREKLVEMLNTKRKVMPMNAIHAKAYLSQRVVMGHGNLIDAGVIINTGATLANHCIVRQGVQIDYDSTLADFVQVGVGSSIGSQVSIDSHVFIGSGVTIVAGVTIGERARIGAGSVVVEHVEAGSTVFGNPAKKIS